MLKHKRHILQAQHPHTRNHHSMGCTPRAPKLQSLTENSVKILFWPKLRSKFRSKFNILTEKFSQNVGQNIILTDIFGQNFRQNLFWPKISVKKSVKNFWPIGQKVISTNVFPTDSFRSKFCIFSVKISVKISY